MTTQEVYRKRIERKLSKIPPYTEEDLKRPCRKWKYNNL